ncbi:Flp pilus assembly complex ATPase component TadA (plasmid) [Cupriavidus pinatubonensis]|uniref:ATPase, T2SS/T4P/T4SS family n=1 Tax=Cupriavidus pinatubonensis TaxID=248026 RepID=UPI001C7389F9|nr:Flp pilus assembly complex ATPase component TadA [Cupriavidus pinatubonensis]
MQADMVVVGEIRDGAAAAEAVRASASGQLIFGTIHAGSGPQALEKLAILAGSGDPNLEQRGHALFVVPGHSNGDLADDDSAS